MSTTRRVLICVVFIVSLLLTACSGPEESNPTPTSAITTESASEPTIEASAVLTLQPATAIATTNADDTPTEAPVPATATIVPAAEPTNIPEAPTNTPRPTRTPRPEPTPTATQQPAAAEFVDPYGATLKLLNELGIDPQMPWGKLFLEYAHTYPWIFTFSTVDVGTYNSDTYQFMDWLRWYAREMMGPYDSSEPTFLGTLRDQLVLQLHAAIYQPDSLVGRMVRDAERLSEAGSAGSSFTALITMLIEPAYNERWVNPYFVRGISREIQEHAQAYAVAFSRSTRYFGFADYLAGIGYEVPLYDGIGDAPAPTATPTQRGNAGNLPMPGAVVYDRSLTEWKTGEFEAGWFEVVEDEFHIGAWEGAGRKWGRTHAAWTNEIGYSDIAASVSVRAVTDASSGGCIAVRQDANAGEYNFCMLSNGRTWATYDAADANGEWHQEVLLADQQRAGSNAPGEWNRLTIIASGDQLWFLVNDVLQGTVRHGGRGSGAVAIQVTNWAANSAEWAFRDLVIQEAQ